MPSLVRAFNSRQAEDPREDRARVESIAGVEVLWTRGDGGNHAVQQGAHHDLVAGLAGRDLVPEGAVGVDGRVLKDVDHVGDLPLLVSPRSQCFDEVAAAAAMVLNPVIDPVTAAVAHGGDQVVDADVVADDLVYLAPPV